MRNVAIVIVLCAGSCMGQVISGLSSVTSDYNVTAVKASDGTHGTVQTITCTGGNCTANVWGRTNAQLTWAIGNSITIAASGSNGDSIVDASCLGTFTLTAANNPARNYTYVSSCSANYNASDHDYELQGQECVGVNMWQIMRRAVASGSYEPDTVGVRLRMNDTLCGGTVTNPAWSVVYGPLFQWTSTTCSTGSGPADIRNWAFGKIIHGGVTTLMLVFTGLCTNGVTFSPLRYVYLDNPDASNPLAGWSSTVSGPTGIPGTALGSFTDHTSPTPVTHTPTLAFGRMFCTKLDCSEKGFAATATTGIIIVSTTDGHTWSFRARPIIGSAGATNEVTGSLFNDDDHMLLFTRQAITAAGQCTTHLCNMIATYSSNFTATTPTWTTAVANIPVDPRNVATGIEMPSPELICGILSSKCWLTFTLRYGAFSTNQTSLKSTIFDPTTYVSTLDFSGLTIQNLYDGVSVAKLGGYAEPILGSDGSHLAIWWHDYNYFGVSGSIVPLNTFAITGAFDTGTNTLTMTCSGAANGRVDSDGGNIACVCTAGVASGGCSNVFATGSSVVLTASPAGGTSFGGYSGCSMSASPGTCVVSADTTFSAAFNTLVSKHREGGLAHSGGKVVKQ